MLYPHHGRPRSHKEEGGPRHAPTWADLGSLPSKTHQNQKVTCWRMGRVDGERKLPGARKRSSGCGGRAQGFTLEGRKGLTTTARCRLGGAACAGHSRRGRVHIGFTLREPPYLLTTSRDCTHPPHLLSRQISLSVLFLLLEATFKTVFSS